MDVLTLIGFAIIGFIMILSLLFLAGLKSKVPVKAEKVDQCEINFEMWEPGVPDQIVRHYQLVYGNKGMPKVRSAVIQGEAKYKISNLWMPVLYQTSLEHGIGFLRDLEFYWYGKVIMRGIDFWLKDIGALRVNGVMQMSEVGVKVTESQWVSYWAESLLTGTFDFFDERLTWEVEDQNHVILLLPAGAANTDSNRIALHIYIDGYTGKIQSIQGERYRGQLGKERIKWRLRVRKWNKHGEISVPSYDVQWLDQKKPWCRYQVLSVQIMNEKDKQVRNTLHGVPVDQYKSTALESNKKKKHRQSI